MILFRVEDGVFQDRIRPGAGAAVRAVDEAHPVETGDAVFAGGRDIAGCLPGPFGLIAFVRRAVLPYYARDAVIHETCGHAFDAGDDFLPTVFVEDLFVVRTPVGISGDVECEGVRGITVDLGYEMPVNVYLVFERPEKALPCGRREGCTHTAGTAGPAYSYL